MKNITIAIDGHSSCGKSTFAKMLAKEYGYKYIDTGAMYRAVTLYAIENGYINDKKLDVNSLVSNISNINIDFIVDDKGRNDLLLNGEIVESKIRSMEVSSHVSMVSAVSEVRKTLVAFQQNMGKGGSVVMDGRDIGTAVFPKAEVKIFMTASVEIRAKRRFLEYQQKGVEVDFQEICDNISERDRLDEGREISPLVQAEDAHLLDNSNMTPTQQMVWVKDIINKAQK
ncbi:MAG: (d)CMP kinase [Bacteroidetes bacterium]|nr:(d)CMP kinase [Bacteroidota bacterium]